MNKDKCVTCNAARVKTYPQQQNWELHNRGNYIAYQQRQFDAMVVPGNVIPSMHAEQCSGWPVHLKTNAKAAIEVSRRLPPFSGKYYDLCRPSDVTGVWMIALAMPAESVLRHEKGKGQRLVSFCKKIIDWLANRLPRQLISPPPNNTISFAVPRTFHTASDGAHNTCWKWSVSRGWKQKGQWLVMAAKKYGLVRPAWFPRQLTPLRINARAHAVPETMQLDRWCRQQFLPKVECFEMNKRRAAVSFGHEIITDC